MAEGHFINPAAYLHGPDAMVTSSSTLAAAGKTFLRRLEVANSIASCRHFPYGYEFLIGTYAKIVDH
jgi:hypothetical protein